MATQASQNPKKTVVEQPKSKVLDTILDKMGEVYNIPAKNVLSTLRTTALKMNDSKREANDAEIVGILSAASKYGFDPFLREIYAFRTKSGLILPVVGVDGWIKKMNEHKRYLGHELKDSGEMVTIGKSKECFTWMEITIYVKDLEHPVVIREYLDECYNGGKFANDPWDTHTKRFLRHKTFIQGIRVAFNITGVYDPDEAERVVLSETPTTDSDDEKPDNTKAAKKSKVTKTAKTNKTPKSTDSSKTAVGTSSAKPAPQEQEPPINEDYDDSTDSEQDVAMPVVEKEAEKKPSQLSFF